MSAAALINFFRASGATIIRGRRLFEIQLIVGEYEMSSLGESTYKHC